MFIGDGIPHDYESATYLIKGTLKTLLDRYQNRAYNYLAEKVLTHSLFMNETQMKDIDYAVGCLLSANTKFTCIQSPPHLVERLPPKLPAPTKCKLPTYIDEVVAFHHGLRWCDQRIKDYIRKGDIIDAGAYIGDSACIMSDYTDHKIYSYEISKLNFETTLKVIKDNNLEGKVIPIRKGLGSHSGAMRITDTSTSEARISSNSKGEELPIVTIDKDARLFNMKVSFMKADCEGFDLEILKGAAETIKRDRPVISFQTYHNFEEFFGIPEFIMSFPNYMFYFQINGRNRVALGEYGIFAYPAEILYPTFEPSQNDEIKNFPGVDIETWKAF